MILNQTNLREGFLFEPHIFRPSPLITVGLKSKCVNSSVGMDNILESPDIPTPSFFREASNLSMINDRSRGIPLTSLLRSPLFVASTIRDLYCHSVNIPTFFILTISATDETSQFPLIEMIPSKVGNAIFVANIVRLGIRKAEAKLSASSSALFP